jgi:hypothetical protein
MPSALIHAASKYLPAYRPPVSLRAIISSASSGAT